MPAQGQALIVAPAEGYTQLVAHVLAHVPLDQPGELHDPRYVAHVGPRIPSAERAMLEHDAALLGRLWDADRRHDALHGLFELHADLASFAATRSRALAELAPHEVRAPRLLAQLVELPGAELLHTMLALALPSFDPIPTFELTPIQEALVRLVPVVSELAHARVEIVAALGVHGRAFDTRILVGAPAAWNACTPASQAVLAAHEVLVRASAAPDYAGQEWDALRGLARALSSLEDPPLRAAHRDWLASLDLGGLLALLVTRDQLDPGTARELDDHPTRRAALLAEVARAGAQ